ncbi:sugar phosphate isomerase/epimerase [Geomonas sp. RF6]|uniref:sugar phosphate isomerase/epimerase family protein n=1 Tax=Geomonas sp. RF6 TaxID=2897342 RepID=UPI001E30F741|nr:sugar phosphate isomerase/epimerase family protein [Geomonas sp. RF6]UFS71723.1 sugar phosphate isomerase/epimerase [Geomonas sp. RF6]
MIIGAMNHPGRNTVEEIHHFARLGLDFIDLTLEPPEAGWWQCDPQAIKRALAETGMGIVGHTAYYLPIAHPFEDVRRGAVEAFRRSIAAFAEIGAKVMNIHPDAHAPMHDRAFVIAQNLRSLGEILQAAEGAGVKVMVENLPRNFNTAAQLGELLDPLPQLGLHLDLGHTELSVQTSSADEILARFGPRIMHVHLHDNKGGDADLHLPLGAGVIDIPKRLASLKKTGYDGTITLEVFTPDPGYLKYSAARLREMWAEA